MQKFVQWLERFKEYSSGKAIAIKNRIIDISQRSRTLLNDGQTILECSTRIGYLKARQLVLKNAELLSLTKSEKHALELYGDYLEFRELSHYHFTDDSPSVLAEYCDSMAMSYSYKPVLLIALASIMDANGGCSVDDLTAEIMRYYASRIEQGLIAERSNSVFAGVVMLEEAKKVVIQNPVKALIAADVITWNGKQKRIAFTPGYLPSSEAQVEMVRSVCIKRLDAYYQRIQDNKVVIDSTNVRTYFAELLEQVDNPQLRIKIQECFDFIYGLNKTENKGESEPCVVAIDDDDVRTQRRNSYVPERISEADERKVGKLVKECMAALSENGYVFSETQIINFQSAEWSKKMLGLYYPLCKSFDESKSISEQRIDHLGNGRYWNRVFRFGNHQFLITSEWYKQSRPLFIKWFNSLSCTNE